jgi:hypothetical protein
MIPYCPSGVSVPLLLVTASLVTLPAAMVPDRGAEIVRERTCFWAWPP